MSEDEQLQKPDPLVELVDELAREVAYETMPVNESEKQFAIRWAKRIRELLEGAAR